MTECRYYGRDFTTEEMALLRALIAGPPALNRNVLSKEFCRRIGWFKPDGGLKDMMARVTMLAMHRDGLITLPPPKWRQNRPGPIVFGPDTEAPLIPAPETLDEVRPLGMRIVVRGTREGRLWNEFVARYHYLGYKTLVGAQMRYAVHDRGGRPLAMLGFSTAAWKLAPRDAFIGWTPAVAREEPSPRDRQPEVPHPALGQNPQPRLASPRHHPPATARATGPNATIPPPSSSRPSSRRHATPAPSTGHRDGFTSEPHRDADATTGYETLRQAQKGRLAPPPAKRLATHPQSVESHSGATGCG